MFIYILRLQRKKSFLLFAAFFIYSVCIAQLSYDTLYERAKQSLFANDYTKSLELYNACLKEAIKLHDNFRTGNSYIGIGINYDKSGDYQNALTNYFKALPAYEAAANIKKQAGTLKNIGNTYRTISSYDKAAEFFQQALQKFGQLKDSTGIANVTNDLGILYMDQLQNDTAIVYFTRVITIYKKYAVKDVDAYALNNLGVVYSRVKDYVSSYKYYTAALQAMRAINNEYGVALVLNNIGDMLNRVQKYNDAMRYSRQGQAIAEKINSKDLLSDSYENMAQSLRQLADYKQSNEYLEKLLNIKDTIFKEESAKSYAEMETRYQNERKQKEIILLKKDNSIKDLYITNQRRTRTFLIITLVLIFTGTILIYRGYAAKKKLNTALGQSNEKLDEANQSKTKLLSIITHDLRTPVSNLFNFLQLQKSSPGRFTAEQQDKYNLKINDAAENVLNAMEDVLVWSKGQMEKFTPIIETVNLHVFFDEIINLNTAAAGQKNITLTKNCPADLNMESDINFLKIVIRNLVANAVRFTPANGKIQLMAEKKHAQIIITVRDNGEGIPPEQVATIFTWNSIRSDSTGLGLRLAKEFTEKLKGTISVHSIAGQGTDFILVF